MNKSSWSIYLALCILILLLSGCASASTPVVLQTNPPTVAPAPQQNIAPEATPPSAEIVTVAPHTIAEVEALAGFNVKEPLYLPAGVSFDFATYQESPNPTATLHFKLVHEQYGDMGAFFQIMQGLQSEAPADTVSCGEATQGCEILHIENLVVVYRLNAGGTEGLDWYADGFSFRLLRTAGEPNKIYKDELVQVVRSMKS